MKNNRRGYDDEKDRQRVLDYLQSRPGQSCEEAEIKSQTGVAKNRVRNLMRGVDGIDADKLESGVVCWNPPDQTRALAD